MNKEIIEFGKRMDRAEDKALLVEYAEGATQVLDLGAGTGKISRDIAEKYGAHCDAVDIQFKDNCQNSDNVTYYGMSIANFLKTYKDKKYDCIILSAIIHELDALTLDFLKEYLPTMMKKNCRILIREPFYERGLGPIKAEDTDIFIDLVSKSISANKALKYYFATKLSLGGSMFNHQIPFSSAIDYANLAFVVSYGEQSWEREKHEFRYAYSLDWCKDFFNFTDKRFASSIARPFTGFQVYPVLDSSYKDHFIEAGIPGKAFDLLQYTGMIIVIDYSKGD